MAVSEQDLRHAASLARIALAPDRARALLAELNGILAHMDVLAKVDTSDVDAVHGVGAGGMRLRADDGAQYPMARERDALGAELRDGLYVVPRLDSHARPPDAEDGA